MVYSARPDWYCSLILTTSTFSWWISGKINKVHTPAGKNATFWRNYNDEGKHHYGTNS